MYSFITRFFRKVFLTFAKHRLLNTYLLLLVPSVKKVTYSTCSIYAEENERVVKKILQMTDDFVLADRDKVIPSWERRGDDNELDEGSKIL